MIVKLPHCPKCGKIMYFNILDDGQKFFHCPSCFFNFFEIDEELELRDENVEHPNHYNQGSVECKEAIRSALGDDFYTDGFCRGNAIKYIWRYPFKNGVEDIKKAIFYLNEILSIKSEE